MHVRLLIGHAADAVLSAATISEIALRVIAGEPAESQARLGPLIDDLRRSGRTEHLDEASWLEQRRIAVLGFTGQVRQDLDDDGRHASKIAIRLALVARLITESEWNDIRRRAALQASEPEPSALLRLDRAAHRKTFDDVLLLRRRVLILLVHGEVDQGHDHFAEIMAWRLRSGRNGMWRELVVRWPEPSASPGLRLAALFEELAYALGIQLEAPDQDPSTPDGAVAWAPALAQILAAIDASRDRLLVRHVLHWISTGAAGDDALIDAYVRAIWSHVAVRPGERVVVDFGLRRIERAGLPWSKTWRIARAERAAARAIAATLDRFHVLPGGMCVSLPELTSVHAADLVDWLRAEGGRRREDAELEADQLVSSTRGGRFDLIVQRLAALNLDRHRKTRR